MRQIIQKRIWIPVVAILTECLVLGLLIQAAWTHQGFLAAFQCIFLLLTSLINISNYAKCKVADALLKDTCDRLESIYQRELTCLVREMEIPTA